MAKINIEVLPLIIAAMVGLLASHLYSHASILAAAAIAIPAELVLVCVTFERKDGTRVFGKWWW